MDVRGLVRLGACGFALSWAAAGFGATSVGHEVKLTDPNGLGGYEFGWSVALDGGTLAVGADLDSQTVPGGGAVYVYTNAGSVPTLQTRLEAASPAPDDNLGVAVDVKGDVLLAGAFHRFAATPGPGKAYVFRRNAGVWTQEAELTAFDGQDNDAFGWSVGLRDNLAVIGAPRAWVGSPSGGGAVYIFERIDGVWTFVQRIIRSNEYTFGWSLSLDDNTLAVGAPFGTSPSKGRVFIYQRDLDGTWGQRQTLAPADLEENADFGNSVSLSGHRLLVGAWFNSAGGTFGSVYFYDQIGFNWYEAQRIDAPGGARAESFGEAVALDGDRAVVTDSGLDTATKEDVGAVYVYERSGSTWRPAGTLLASDPEIDYFGASAAVRGGVIAVGAPYYWDVIDDEMTGAAYVLQPAAGSKLQIRNALPDNESNNAIVAKLKGLQVDLPLPGSPDDPTCAGSDTSSIEITSIASGESVSQVLPCANWQQTSSGYRYRDLELDDGPCGDVYFKATGTTKIRCAGRGPSVLDFDLEPGVPQAPIVVRLTVATQSYCTAFGGKVTSDGTDGQRFMSSKAGAPSLCSAP